MDRYKDYVARTQQDRILLDILVALENVNEQLKQNKVTRALPSLPSDDGKGEEFYEMVKTSPTAKAKVTTSKKTTTTKKSTTTKRGAK
jgi:hypothetical protein